MEKILIANLEETNYEKKFVQITYDLKKYRVNQLKKMSEVNCRLVIAYLDSKMREVHLKPASIASTIDRLSRLLLFLKNKPFKDVTTEDIFLYLDTLKRTETEDPMHKWISP